MKKIGSLIVMLTWSFFALSQAAPDFTITSSQQEELSLYQDYLDQGKSVVLELFFTTCPPCISHAPAFQALYEDWGSGQIDVEFIALSIKSTENNSDVENYRLSHGHTFPGAGSDGGALEAILPYTDGTYGSFFGTPTFIVIAPDGTVNYNVDGFGIPATMTALDMAIAATGAQKTIAVPAGFSGKIYNREGMGISGLSVHIESNSNIAADTITNDLGDFEIIANQFFVGDSITIHPNSFDSDKTGVSTWDIIFVLKHILQFDQFDSPYDYFAADINNDGKVSATDVIELRKYILGYYDDLPDNADIQYFDANFVFNPDLSPLDQNPPNFISDELIDASSTGFDFCSSKNW